MEGKKQYAVNVTLADGSTYCGKIMYNAKTLKDRYYNTLEEAEECKRALLDSHNRKFNYDDNGERIETTACGCLGVSTVITSKMDELNRIIKVQILVRTVSPWEKVTTD